IEHHHAIKRAGHGGSWDGGSWAWGSSVLLGVLGSPEVLGSLGSLRSLRSPGGGDPGGNASRAGWSPELRQHDGPLKPVRWRRPANRHRVRRILGDAMARLARSLDGLKPHYDVVVVGSGYGGGVAASRLARAGKRVAVLERGREFLTGEFPSRFPDLRGEMQLTGKRLRVGSPTGLYDVRFGEDMHVLIGCGLGGG